MALQKDATKRYPSGQDFAADLTRVHQRLRVEAIDLFYQHRVDPEVPIEDVIRQIFAR